jgi:Na+/H+ antiporter
MVTRDAVILVFVVTLVITMLANRIRTPMPVVLATAGAAIGVCWHLVPALPPLRFSGDIVLFVFLPPLLTRAAYALPLGAFRQNLRSIGLLAVGLVLLTMFAVAWTARAFDPALTWTAALLLGAIVAPPDPVAAASVASETGLGHRLVTILEGEGLVNDAVAIVAYKLALDTAFTGDFSWAHTGLSLAREAPLGIFIGIGAGWVVSSLRRRLDDVTLEAAISLLVPYVTYEIADRIGASGVLAVVALGFTLRRRSERVSTPTSRIASAMVWSAVELATTTLVFMLVGLELGIVAEAAFTLPRLVAGAAVGFAVIALRMLWMHTVPPLLRLVPLPGGGGPLPSRRELTVVGWAGMRGVVSMALALALPVLPGAEPGTDLRPTVIVLSSVVVIMTLLVQGWTLLPLVHRLGVGDSGRDARDEARTRLRARHAGIASLHRQVAAETIPRAMCDSLTTRLETGDVGIVSAGTGGHELNALTSAIDAQRRVVMSMRDAGRISDALAGRLATELDVDAMRLEGDASRLSGD